MEHKRATGESASASVRVLGWFAGVFILSALFMLWVGEQSWPQNTHTLQSCNTNNNNAVNVSMALQEEDHNAGTVLQKEVEQCNLFRGKWVYDESYVLYADRSCPFVSNDFNCRKNGRVDSNYERWRWQPHHCELPRFNASLMLETLRGKRLVYVGDSINRNQWESMLCLLRAVVPHDGGNMKVKDNGELLQYFIQGYNSSIEFSWAPFLIEQNQNNGKKTLRIDMIAQQSQQWRNADILVFNSWHWWTHKGGKLWGKKVGGGCFNETEPIDKMVQEAEEFHSERRRLEIVEKVVGESKIVELLNITGLSMYRKDAHASVYTSKYINMTNKNDYHYADCSHWCLPGLPDVWNNLLYALLI